MKVVIGEYYVDGYGEYDEFYGDDGEDNELYEGFWVRFGLEGWMMSCLVFGVEKFCEGVGY